MLVLGADRNEGRNDEETERIFRECGRERRVNLSLFGPNLVGVGIDGRLDKKKKKKKMTDDARTTTTTTTTTLLVLLLLLLF